MKIRTIILAFIATLTIGFAQTTDSSTAEVIVVPEQKAEVPGPKTPEQIAKMKVLEALTDFLDMSKEALQEGGKMAKDGIKGGVKMAKEQIPLVLEELVRVRCVEVTLNFIFCLIIIFLLHYGAKKTCTSKLGQDKEMVTDTWGNDLWEVGTATRLVCTIIKWVGTVIVLIVIITHIRDWVLPWAAPRVYLIEYAVELVRTLKN